MNTDRRDDEGRREEDSVQAPSRSPEQQSGQPAEPPPSVADISDATQSAPVVGASFEAWYVGPIPLPDVARGWRDLVPDAPERMLAWVEDERRQRHWMERTYVYFRFAALIGAFILGALVLGGGIYLIDQGHGVWGLAAIIAEFSALVVALLVRQFAGNGHESGQTNGPHQFPGVGPRT